MAYLLKRLGLAVVMVSFLLCGISQAAETQEEIQAVEITEVVQDAPEAQVVIEAVKKPEPPRKKTPAELAAEKAAQVVAAKKAESVNAAKAKLNNTSWEITLTPSGGQGTAIKDTLRFTENSKVESATLVAEGFAPSNMTVRIKREDKIIWETMQTGKDGQLAFWRGDIKRDPKDGTLGDTMNGVLSWHKNDKAKTVTDYSFISESKDAIKPGEPKKEEAAVVVEEDVVAVVSDAQGQPAAVVEVEEVAVVEEAAPVVKEEAPKKKNNFWGR